MADFVTIARLLGADLYDLLEVGEWATDGGAGLWIRKLLETDR